jgi:PIN domain nuclease of toxin-antitoxin system
MIYIDTHVAAWLYAGLVDKLNPAVMDLLNREILLVSPMVVLELEYLYETGKTADSAESVFKGLQDQIGIGICKKPFSEVIFLANHQKWTRDPFDRIIVAQSAIDSSLLITKDRLIHQHYPHAFWN